MPLDPFEKSHVVLNVFLNTLKAHASVDLAPWVSSLDPEQRHVIAALASRMPSDSSALVVVSACARMPGFCNDMFRYAADPERFGWSAVTDNDDYPTSPFTALDVAAGHRNEAAFRVLLGCLDENPDIARKMPHDQSVTERVIRFLCYGDGITERPAGPLVDCLVRHGSSLPEPSLACVEDLPDGSETKMAILLRSNSMREKDCFDKIMAKGKEGGRPLGF